MSRWLLTIVLISGCSGDTKDAANTPDAGFDADAADSSGAFNVEDAGRIVYRAMGGLGFCINPEALLLFDLDVASGEVTAERAVPGDEATDECLQTEDACLVRQASTFTLTPAEIEGVKSRLAAIPAPMCTPDECDPCLIETLEVDGSSETSFCCGVQEAEGFDESFADAAGYMQGLVVAADN